MPLFLLMPHQFGGAWAAGSGRGCSILPASDLTSLGLDGKRAPFISYLAVCVPLRVRPIAVREVLRAPAAAERYGLAIGRSLRQSFKGSTVHDLGLVLLNLPQLKRNEHKKSRGLNSLLSASERWVNLITHP